MAAHLNAAALKWVEALESGRFKQGRERLRRGDLMCCLGVACELAIEDGVPLRVETACDGSVSYDGLAGVLPERVRTRLGLRYGGAHYGNTQQLSADNDAGATFAEIAATIRSRSDLFEPRP